MVLAVMWGQPSRLSPVGLVLWMGLLVWRLSVLWWCDVAKVHWQCGGSVVVGDG